MAATILIVTNDGVLLQLSQISNLCARSKTQTHLASFEVLVHVCSNPDDAQGALAGQDLSRVEHSSPPLPLN